MANARAFLDNLRQGATNVYGGIDESLGGILPGQAPITGTPMGKFIARKRVTREVSSDLQDIVKGFIAMGMPKEIAVERTLADIKQTWMDLDDPGSTISQRLASGTGPDDPFSIKAEKHEKFDQFFELATDKDLEKIFGGFDIEPNNIRRMIAIPDGTSAPLTQEEAPELPAVDPINRHMYQELGAGGSPLRGYQPFVRKGGDPMNRAMYQPMGGGGSPLRNYQPVGGRGASATIVDEAETKYGKVRGR